MATLLSNRLLTAKKEYNCDASEVIHIDGRPDYLKTIADCRAYIAAKQTNFKILKGQKYLRQSGVHYGDFYCVKMIPEMHELCLKYELYED